MILNYKANTSLSKLVKSLKLISNKKNFLLIFFGWYLIKDRNTYFIIIKTSINLTDKSFKRFKLII